MNDQLTPADKKPGPFWAPNIHSRPKPGGADMVGLQCQLCKNYWACTAIPSGDFRAITKWCPDCIPKVLKRTLA